MDISKINVSNAYTANNYTTQTENNTPLENKKTQAPEATRNQETLPSQAFQVNITQEAQNRLAAEATPPVEAMPPIGTPAADNGSQDSSEQNQSPVATQKARQVVNIVA